MLKHCKGKDPKLQDILDNGDLVVPLANYIQATGRFEQERKGEERDGGTGASNEAHVTPGRPQRPIKT